MSGKRFGRVLGHLVAYLFVSPFIPTGTVASHFIVLFLFVNMSMGFVFTFNLAQYALAMIYICMMAGTLNTNAIVKVMRANSIASCIGGLDLRIHHFSLVRQLHQWRFRGSGQLLPPHRPGALCRNLLHRRDRRHRTHDPTPGTPQTTRLYEESRRSLVTRDRKGSAYSSPHIVDLPRIQNSPSS